MDSIKWNPESSWEIRIIIDRGHAGAVATTTTDDVILTIVDRSHVAVMATTVTDDVLLTILDRGHAGVMASTSTDDVMSFALGQTFRSRHTILHTYSPRRRKSLNLKNVYMYECCCWKNLYVWLLFYISNFNPLHPSMLCLASSNEKQWCHRRGRYYRSIDDISIDIVYADALF